MNRHLQSSATVPEPEGVARASAVFAAAEGFSDKIAALKINHGDVRSHIYKIGTELRQIDDELCVARGDAQEWLERHFVKTADAARILGISPRFLQALAAEGPATFAGADGRPVEIALRAVRHGGYWFLRHDVEQTLRARRADS